MKILHTSDWHLGKRVNDFPMLDDQKYILNEIVRVVKEEKPDVIIIAGDVYQTSTPAAEAVSLMNEYINQLHALCKHIFVLSGNHDSAERIAFGAEIMNQTGVHFSQVFNSKPQKITLRDEYGDVNIYMLPFVRPVDVRAVYENELEESDQTIETYDAAVQKAIDAMAPDYSQRNILVAHQYFKGGERCEGEDSVGGLDDVDAEIVKNFDYVALGHLHRPQHVQQYPHIRYSGSPLKYSFSEVNHQKSVSIIECNEKGNLTIRERELIPLHDWIDIRGKYDELMSEQFYRGKGYENKYVRITLTDEDDIVDGMKKLKGVYPLAMSLEYDNTRTRTESKVGIGDIQKKPLELIEEFFEKQNGQAMNGDQHELVTNLINKLEL